MFECFVYFMEKNMRNLFITVILFLVAFSLSAANITWFRQDFESPLLDGHGKGQSNATGAWVGLEVAEMQRVSSPGGHSGISLLVTRVDGHQSAQFRGVAPFPKGHNYTLGVSFYLEVDDKSYFLLLNEAQERISGFNLDAGNDLCIWTEDNGWGKTELKVPIGWFRLEADFDVIQKICTPCIVLPDGTRREGRPWPITAKGVPVCISVGNIWPAGTKGIVDDIAMAYEPYSAVKGRSNVAAGITPVIQEDGVVMMELAKLSEISTIHAERVRGSMIAVEGSNAMGQWQTLVQNALPDANNVLHCDFEPERVSRVRISGVESMGAIALYEIARINSHEADNIFQEKVSGEFYLPMYSEESCGDLHLFNSTGEPIAVTATLFERTSGQQVQPPQEAVLRPGENVINFPLAELVDGEYVAEVRQRDGDHGGLKRLLRFQTWKEPKCTAVPDMRNKKLFFPDEYYFQQSRNIALRAAVAKPHNVTRRIQMTDLKSFFQSGCALYAEDGRLHVIYHTMDNFFRTDSEKFYHTSAPLDNLEEWSAPEQVEVSALKGRTQNVLSENVISADNYPKPRPDGKIRTRLYDPEIDGTPNVRQMEIKYIPWMVAGTSGGGDVPDWEGITPPRRSTWVLWHKEPGLSLIMGKEPLLNDGLSGGDFEDPKDSNDNFAGQWLSDDGKTLFYARGHIVKRYPPYNVPYDNGFNSSRLLTIFATQDGIHFTRKTMARPTHDFPPGTQHYGAMLWRMRGGDGLRAAMVMKYMAREQRIGLELSVSRDNLHWKTFPGQPLFVDNTPKGTWLAGYVSASPYSITVDGKTFVMMGWNGTPYHIFAEVIWGREDFSSITPQFLKNFFSGRQVETWPLFKQFNGWDEIAAYIRNTCINVGVMEIREDGLFYAESVDGDFTTVPVHGAGRLVLNGETSGEYGRITVELLQNGRTLGTALFSGDKVNHALFDNLPESDYQLRVHLKDAKVYCFAFQK